MERLHLQITSQEHEDWEPQGQEFLIYNLKREDLKWLVASKSCQLKGIMPSSWWLK